MPGFEKLKNIEALLLATIILAGAFLYFHKIDSTPSGLYVDEAATGYNAYSILKTGKDEYGKAYPVAMRFFGSYSPPLYTYLTTLPISLFGLNLLSVRFISAISGVVSIVVVFLFLRSLQILKSKSTLFLGTLFFTISPWTVFYSRAGYENYLGFLLFCLGALLLWRGFKKPLYLVFALLTLSLSTYADHSQRLIAPLFLLGTALVFRKELFVKKNRRYLLRGATFALLFQMPHLFIIFTPALFTKSSLFYTDVVISQAEKISLFLPMALAVPLAFVREFFSQFFGYFSPKALFFLPDPDPQRSAPELSVLYTWMVIPYLVGLYCVFQKRKDPGAKFVLLLSIIAPIPSSLVADPFSSQRALSLLLPLTLIISLGIDRIIIGRRPKIWVPTAIFLLVSSLVLLWRSYFVFLPKERAKVWGYGYEQLANQIGVRQNENFVIDQSRIKPAYIELLFFLAYPPQKFHQEIDPGIKKNYYTDLEFNPNLRFSNIETRNINWEEDIYREQILVGDELAISTQQAEEHFLERIFEIRSPVDEIIFVGHKTSPDKKCAQDPNNVHCKNIRRKNLS